MVLIKQDSFEKRDVCIIILHFSFIHSFWPLQVHYYSLLRGTPDYSTDTVTEFHAEAPQATVSKGLYQDPYMAARAGVEPTTLRLSHRLNQCATMSHKFYSLGMHSRRDMSFSSASSNQAGEA